MIVHFKKNGLSSYTTVRIFSTWGSQLETYSLFSLQCDLSSVIHLWFFHDSKRSWVVAQVLEFFHQSSCVYNFSEKAAEEPLQSHLSPKAGALHARLNVILILPPGFGDQVSLSLLQTLPLCCLLLFGKLPPHLLTDYLLQNTITDSTLLQMNLCTVCLCEAVTTTCCHCYKTPVTFFHKVQHHMKAI